MLQKQRLCKGSARVDEGRTRSEVGGRSERSTMSKSSPRTTCDYVFRNALIFDGGGGEPFAGELSVEGDSIVEVGPTGTIPSGAGAVEENLSGLALAPGFIDAHTHDDRFVLDAPAMEPKISQGVTTVVVGNSGIPLAPATFVDDPPPPMNLLGGAEAYESPTFAAYASAVSKARPSVNVAALIGDSALRRHDDQRTAESVSRRDDRDARPAEEAMLNGAIGFSTGLFYPPNTAADIDEVGRIAARFAEMGGVYATHMRDEFDDVLESIDETLETAKGPVSARDLASQVRGSANWGRTIETFPKLRKAAATHPVNVDVYPYDAGSKNFRTDLVTDEYRILITWSRPHPGMKGRDLASIAAEWNRDPWRKRRGSTQPAPSTFRWMKRTCAGDASSWR